MAIRWLPNLGVATLFAIHSHVAAQAPPRLHVRAVTADTAYLALGEPAHVLLFAFEPGRSLHVVAPILADAWESSADGVIPLRQPILPAGKRLVDPPHCILERRPYSWTVHGGARPPTMADCGPPPRFVVEADDPPPTEGMWGRYLIVVAVDSAAAPPDVGVLLRDADPVGRPVQWVADQLRTGLAGNAIGARWTFLASVRLDPRGMPPNTRMEPTAANSAAAAHP